MNDAASVAADERLRLFCALRLPDHVVERLAAWQAEHVRAGRAVPRDNLHVTLAFLGSRPRSDLNAIVGALRDAASRAAPIELSVERYREGRSAGMLVLADAGGAAASLADDVQGRLEALRVYRRETRAWLPHVTVVRFKQRPRLDPPVPDLPPFPPSDAAAYLSRLRPSGAEYVVLESVPLISKLGGS